MIRPPTIPQTAGVFALLHAKSRQAYVNIAANLRQRATIWAHHLNAAERDPTHSVRVRDWPHFPSDEWEWWQMEHPSPPLAIAQVKASFVSQGWSLISGRSPKRTTHVVEGIEDTLLGHCRRRGVKAWAGIYKRVERGETAEQAFGLAERTILDGRERAIAQMRVQIRTDDGEGLLTYDEAITMRPALGDVRAKIKRMLKKRPELTSVKLSEIVI